VILGRLTRPALLGIESQRGIDDRRLVLIIGAGPTGLVLALWLTRFGIPVRIIDKTAERGGLDQHGGQAHRAE
jgi:NADPH-dependent 2,4-dienoyl-CoA reductase/sulfur reductase-like enzyme